MFESQLIFEKELMRIRLFRFQNRDDDSSMTVTLPSKWNMKQLAEYVSVFSRNGRLASDSVYMTITSA